MDTIRILLAGDQCLDRQALKALLERETGLSIVGEASNQPVGCDLAHLQPQVVVVLDAISRPATLEATRQVKAAVPGTAVIVLSHREDMEYLQELLSAGVNGYVLKRSGTEGLLSGIRSVAFGDTYLDSGLAQQVAFQAISRRGARDGLSGREADVCKRIAQGYSNKEVAAQLELSVKTVETYKARSMEKLGLATRVDLVRYALLHGWFDELMG